MKRFLWTVIITIMIVLPLTGCDGENKDLFPPDKLLISDLFILKGNLYALHASMDTAYVTKPNDDNIYYPLPGGDDTVWLESKELFYYSKGYKIYCCDINGNNSAIVWEVPDGGKKDIVRIATAVDDMLLIYYGYGKRNSAMRSYTNPYAYDSFDYHSLNIITGETKKVFSDINATNFPVILGNNKTEVFFLRRKNSSAYSLMCVELLTAEMRELGFIGSEIRLSYNTGNAICIIDDTLFFICGYGIYSVPVKGGTPEFHYPDRSGVPDMRLPRSIKEKSGKIYVLMWDSTTNPTGMLCRWNPKTNMLSSAISGDRTFFEPQDFLLNGDTCYVFSWEEVVDVTLAA